MSIYEETNDLAARIDGLELAENGVCSSAVWTELRSISAALKELGKPADSYELPDGSRVGLHPRPAPEPALAVIPKGEPTATIGSLEEYQFEGLRSAQTAPVVATAKAHKTKGAKG